MFKDVSKITITVLKKELASLRQQIKIIQSELKRREAKKPFYYKTMIEFSDEDKPLPVYTLENMETVEYGHAVPASLTKSSLTKNKAPAYLTKYTERYTSGGGSDYDYGHTYHHTRDVFRFRWKEDYV